MFNIKKKIIIIFNYILKIWIYLERKKNDKSFKTVNNGKKS